MFFTKFARCPAPLTVYTLLIMLDLMVSAKKLGVLRLGNSFGAINFDRISGYALVNATYLTIENIKLMSCISKCKSNKGCYSLNFRKRSGGGTLCELNDHNRFAAESELTFQKQPDSEHYEIQSPCKKTVCYNGGQCHVNNMDGTHQCRCPLQYAGEQCERKNIHAEKFDQVLGIWNGELFRIANQLNHTMAATVCQSFGGQLATKEDIGRVASEASFGNCVPSWTNSGSIGYPEYKGGCHAGSTHTGYFSHNCCLDRGTTYKPAWCVKRNIDFCKPGWYAHGRNCYLIRDGDSVTKSDAVEKCKKKNAHFPAVNSESKTSFLKRVCPSCLPIYVGIVKVGDTWQRSNGVSLVINIWAINEPSGDHTCAEWNTKANGLKAISCNTKQGYICMKQMF